MTNSSDYAPVKPSGGSSRGKRYRLGCSPPRGQHAGLRQNSHPCHTCGTSSAGNQMHTAPHPATPYTHSPRPYRAEANLNRRFSPDRPSTVSTR